MVNSEHRIITSYDEASAGDIVHGFISHIKPFGVLISLYGGITALLPKSDIKYVSVHIPTYGVCFPGLAMRMSPTSD